MKATLVAERKPKVPSSTEAAGCGCGCGCIAIILSLTLVGAISILCWSLLKWMWITLT